MMPKVSPRILAAPEATSRICSTLWTRVPSRSAWCSQVVLRYRFRMWHMVESAVSSTDAAGTLQTAMPGDTRHRGPSPKPVLGASSMTGQRTSPRATRGGYKTNSPHGPHSPGPVAPSAGVTAAAQWPRNVSQLRLLQAEPWCPVSLRMARPTHTLAGSRRELTLLRSLRPKMDPALPLHPTSAPTCPQQPA